MTIPIVRQRKKHVKTRTGCKTCRIRRIKCDEEQPACRRCTSTGRDCLGYETRLALPHENQKNKDRNLRPRGNSLVRLNDVSRPLAPLPSGLSPMEAQAFDFFRTQTSYFLPGCADTTTWEMIAMQLSHSEPALMCAIVAVGSMHQARTTRSTGLIMPIYAPEQFTLAMDHYSRALGHVQRCIDSDRQQGNRNSAEVILLACLMFICVELLHGNNHLAIKHLQMGVRILDEHLHGPIPNDLNQRRILLRADSRSTLDLLSGIYVKLECIAATMFGEKQPLLLASLGNNSANDPCPMPKGFRNLDEARLHLDILTSAMYCAHGKLLRLAENELRVSNDVSGLDDEQLECLVSASSRLVDLSNKPELEGHFRAFTRSVTAWSSALACIPPNPEHEDHQVRLLLEIQLFDIWLTSSIWLDRTERMGDRFNNSYHYMLSRIEEYLERAFQDSDYVNAPRAGGPLRTFTLNHGVLIPLFGIAARCRDSRVRRRALLIPSRLHIQESLVDSDFVAAVLERIVDIEEDAARNINGFPPDRPLTCEDVPEAARFMDANISMRDGQGRTVRLICCQRAQTAGEELTLKEYEFTLGKFGSLSEGSIIPEGAFPCKMTGRNSRYAS